MPTWAWILFIAVVAAGGWGLTYVWDNLLLWLSEKDVWWSPYRPLPPEGNFYYLTEGKEAGSKQFAKLVSSLSKTGYIQDGNRFRKLRKDGDDIDPKDPSKGKQVGDEKHPDPPRLGIIWVGFFKRYYTRKWVQTRLNDEGSMEKKTREGHIFFLQFNLATIIEDAETAAPERIGVTMTVPFTVRILDPVKAEFLTGKPEDIAVNVVKAAGIQYAAWKTYNEILGDVKEKDSDFIKEIIKVNPGEDDGTTSGALIARFGIEVAAPYLAALDLADQTFKAATQKRARAQAEGEAAEKEAEFRVKVAQKDADALRAQAEGEADATRMRGEALAQAETQIAGAFGDGPNTAALAMASAVRTNTAASTLVINSGSAPTPVAVPLPAVPPEPAPRRVTVYDATGKPVKPTAPAASATP